MKKRGDDMYNPAARIRNPKTVAELNDANKLRGLAFALEQNLDELSAAGARHGVMHAITILNGAAKAITP